MRLRLALVTVLAALALPSSLLAAPNLVRTLPNKMTLVVRENRTRPLVTIQAWIKAGQRDESRQQRGVATVVSQVLLQATKNRPPGKIQADLDLIGGGVGSEVGYGYTSFQVTVPARSFGTGLDVLSDIVLHPRFDPRDLDQGIAQSRVATRAVLGVPERASVNPARDALHPGSPLSEPLAVPELELANIILNVARTFYSERYVAENMMIVVVGDLDPEDVARKVEIAFQDASKAKAPSRARVAEKPLAATAFVSAPNPQDTPGAAVTAAFRAPAWGSADALALDALLAVLVDTPSSRAEKVLEEGGGDFILAAAQRSFNEDGGTVSLSLRADPARMKEAEAALLTLIAGARSTPVSQEELNAAVHAILGRDLFYRAELPGLGRSTALACLQGRPGADEMYEQRLKALKPEDLAAVAAQYLDPKHASIVEMMRSTLADSLDLRSTFEKRMREKVGINEAAFGSGPKVSQSTDADRKKRVDGPLAQIPATPLDAGRSRVEKTVLSGGLRAMTGEDHSAPLVTVGVYLGGGVRYENDLNNGATSLLRESLLSSMDPKAGGKAYRISLPDIGRLLPYQDRDMWGLSVSVPADTWKDALARLGTMFTHPDLDTVTVDATRLYVLSALDRWLDDDGAQRARLIFPTKYMVSGYRLPGLGTRKNLIQMPLADLQAWYGKLVVRPNTVVTVFGDVKASEVGPAVEAAFTDLPSRSFSTGTVAQEGEFDGIREKWELGGGPDCTVTLAFNGPPAKSADMPGMYVVNSLLGGPRGWFRQYLSTDPAVKDANSIVSQAIDESPIVATVTIGGPVQEEDTVKLLFRQFKKVAYLQLTGALSDTLLFAKTHAVGTYLATLSTNTSRAFQAGRGELFGLPVDYPVILPAKIDAITSADVQRIGMRYFEKNEFEVRAHAIAETRPGGW
ncbi:MAG: M16 family metallopeptidase [Candidatus Eiseniibacteriota bacterium]